MRASPIRRPAGESARDGEEPRAYLVYLLDGSDPIVVTRYFQEDGHIVFHKYGGWVRIPTYEILEIVPDEPDRTANLPPAPPLPGPDAGRVPLTPEPNLYLTMRGGGNLKVSALTSEGDRVRVAVPGGSFTVPRAEVLGVVRLPDAGEAPEAWLSIEAREGGAENGQPGHSARRGPAAPDARLPYQQSDRPHFLRLASGHVMRVDAFWVDEGEFRFRRLGGVVGIPMSDIRWALPDEIAPVHGRTPVRFARRVAPGLLEVAVRSGYHRVRLTGVAAADGGPADADGPWEDLERGTIVYLEFDRQRYDAEGNWLAYVFLPNGRMLNAELIRAGLAQPFSDGRNVRYLDLLHEIADAPLRSGDPTSE
ncbi:MAG: thermonuclease family protein [Candidatus Rokuibacteriota bacterium]